MFGLNKDCTLVSNIPKPVKNILLVLSAHFSDEIGPSTDHQSKSVIIIHYNDTQGGVETVDKLCTNYNGSLNTKAHGYFLHNIQYCSDNLTGHI